MCAVATAAACMALLLFCVLGCLARSYCVLLFAAVMIRHYIHLHDLLLADDDTATTSVFYVRTYVDVGMS